MTRTIFRKGLQILKATIAISSNRSELLPSLPFPLEIQSPLTDFKDVEEIPYSSQADGSISILEVPKARPHYELSGTRAVFQGGFTELIRRAPDPRFSFWGNQGFLYRFALFLLEKKHLVHSLHACALYQAETHRLFIVAGGAGSGKTVLLLSGLESGLRLFSTETVHFKKEGRRFRWFMGSLVDNVRIGTLRHHFPRFLGSLSPSPEGEWQNKVAMDLSEYSCCEESLVDPEVILLFPRIEEGRDDFVLCPVRDPRTTAKALFDNISLKRSETFLLYDQLPVLGLDQPELAQGRLYSSRQLAGHKKTVFSATILASPRRCWGDLLERSFEFRTRRQ